MYVSDLSAFAAHVADQSVESLTGEHAQDWVDAEAKRGLTGKTIQRKLAAIRSYWAFLTRAKLTTKSANPFAGLLLPKTAKDRVKRAAFSKKQIGELWAAARRNGDEALADLIRLAAYTGARIESLCTTKAENIKIDDTPAYRQLVFLIKQTRAFERSRFTQRSEI
jgi:site-specific recombinase XerD